jgi:hypothetical protein
MYDLGFNAKAVEYWSMYGRYPDFKENNLFSVNRFNNYSFSLLTVQEQWKQVPNTLEYLEIILQYLKIQTSFVQIMDINALYCISIKVTSSREGLQITQKLPCMELILDY